LRDLRSVRHPSLVAYPWLTLGAYVGISEKKIV
jgi:hypothetical protein